MDVVDLLNDRETFADDLVDDASEPSLELHITNDGTVVDSFLAERAIKLQEADAALAQRRDESARKLREARLQAEHPPIREPASPVVNIGGALRRCDDDDDDSALPPTPPPRQRPSEMWTAGSPSTLPPPSPAFTTNQTVAVDDRNVRRVWVRGRECVRKDRHE